MTYYRRLFSLLFLALILNAAYANCPGTKQADELMTPLSRKLIFERVWTTVEDNYVYNDFHGIDWQASKRLYGQEVLNVNNNAAFYGTLTTMINNLQDDHSVYLAPWESCLEDADLAADTVIDSALDVKRLEQNPSVVLVTLKHFDSISLDEEFNFALRQTFKEGDIKTLILDLRHNFGGYLDTAFNILGQFFYGKIGYESDKSGTYPLTNAPGKYYRRFQNTKIIVLVDHDSHSAAEIVAGVLQLERGATIIGSVSAGNTEIILPYDFLDGSRLWLAVSKFTLRNGTSLEGRGVIPDIIVEDENLVFDKVLEFLATENKIADKDF